MTTTIDPAQKNNSISDKSNDQNNSSPLQNLGGINPMSQSQIVDPVIPQSNIIEPKEEILKDKEDNNQLNNILEQKIVLPTLNDFSKNTIDINKNTGNEELAKTSDTRTVSIIDSLLSKGLITKEIYDSAKFEIVSKNVTEEDYLIQKKLVSEKDLLIAKAEAYKIPFIDLSTVELKRDILYKIPYDIAKNNVVIAVDELPEGIRVAMLDPLDIQKVRFLQAYTLQRIVPCFAEEDLIKKIIDTKYSSQLDTEVSQAVESVKGSGVVLEEEVEDFDDLNFKIQNAPVARIVSMILEYGIKFKASDIHIEPNERKVAVRYRIHGILTEKVTLPATLSTSVVSRIKILSQLKIDEHRIPQDGRFEIQLGKTKVDLRVSVMPVVYGEKVVIRILDKTTGILKLEDTGLRASALKAYREALSATQGIILITGPTGSGKTVTLAASLGVLNKPEVNIVTLEDPVEIRIEGVNQVQVNSEVGLNFATGLRSFLRQDPDIIMVGEIRDKETAALAVQAALVGRLVLATLHTNSAAAAIPRLLDMGVESYLLSSVINIIVAQRLPRKLCTNCMVKEKATSETVKKIHEVLGGLKGFDMYSFPKRDFPQLRPGETPNEETLKNAEAKGIKNADSEEIYVYKPKGCEKCNSTGYSGRVGIFEILKMNEKIAKLILEHRSSQTIQEQALQDGMITMLQDGFMKALDGQTTIEEVLRVQN